MENQEEVTDEELDNENPTILDVLMGYKHDSDKIIILGKSLETILNYIEKLENTNNHTNNYLEYLFNQMNNFMSSVNSATLSQQFQIIHNRIDDIENRFERLVEIQMDMNRVQPSSFGNNINADAEQRIVGEISGVRTKIANLEEKISSFQSQLTKIQSSGVAATSRAPTAPSLDNYRPGPPQPQKPRGEVVEESLLKPSSFGGSAPVGGGGGGAPAGGMSIRMAMMSEIRARMSKRRGSEVPKAESASSIGDTSSGEGSGDKDYALPRIHQPRSAKPLEGGIVGKMNQLLESKFKQSAPPGAGNIKISDKTGGGPPRGPPSGPPRGPPSGKSQDNLLSNTSSDIKKDKKKDKKDKDKGKKKDKKDKDGDDSDIADRLASIDEALENL
ncbi:MAG: hypothetical protein EAX96_03555 [Candidatus Lokiarchaeota archaeon]|nr:hypothetical protein [Candidatus Lokiarchaeota archaeon]